jgi:hypothetical protein
VLIGETEKRSGSHLVEYTYQLECRTKFHANKVENGQMPNRSVRPRPVGLLSRIFELISESIRQNSYRDY